MNVLARIAAAALALQAMLGAALADPANVGEPFGRAVVAPNTPVKDAVQENVPGGLDEVIQSNLADDEDHTGDNNPDDVIGHGRNDAPGKN